MSILHIIPNRLPLVQVGNTIFDYIDLRRPLDRHLGWPGYKNSYTQTGDIKHSVRNLVSMKLLFIDWVYLGFSLCIAIFHLWVWAWKVSTLNTQDSVFLIIWLSLIGKRQRTNQFVWAWPCTSSVYLVSQDGPRNISLLRRGANPILHICL